MKTLTVDELFRAKQQSLGLELLTPECDLAERKVISHTVSSPGLVLAGYTERFSNGRIQILGETELAFLSSLPDERQREALERFMALDMPAVFVTKSQDVPPLMLEIATRIGLPIFRSTLKTGDFYRRVQPYLEEHFAPSTTIHGSLADVYGVGVLFVGRSGIGKSECVLDLIERGHRLVADDLVHVRRRGVDMLIGRGHPLQGHHMEIRGIGIIDIPALFGIRAIRQQKRIELVVQLEEWNDQSYYDRTGLESDEVEILGVKLPKVTVPLNPGKNITVLSEVVAMNHLLKFAGVHSAEAFNRRLQGAMRPLREYLEEDYE